MNKRPSHGGEEGPDDLKLREVSSLYGFQWLFDDIFSACNINKYYRKATCCFSWKKFDEISDCILEVSGMHLEIGNFVTSQLNDNMCNLIEKIQEHDHSHSYSIDGRPPFEIRINTESASEITDTNLFKDGVLTEEKDIKQII